MGLLFSRAYGEGYYSDAGWTAVNQMNAPEIRSFPELLSRLRLAMKQAKDGDLLYDIRKDATHVRMILERLSQNDILKPPFDRPEAVANAVNLEAFFTGQRLLYCGLSSLLGATMTSETGLFLVSSLAIN